MVQNDINEGLQKIEEEVGLGEGRGEGEGKDDRRVV